MMQGANTRKGEPRENKFNYTPVPVDSLFANEISFPCVTSSTAKFTYVRSSKHFQIFLAFFLIICHNMERTICIMAH